MMKLSGEDIADSVKTWVKEEISASPSRVYDLGKFFFTVSSTTFGLILVAEKLGEPAWDWALITSLTIIGLSGFWALLLVIPKDLNLEENPDLQILRNKIISRTQFASWIWFVVWATGLLFGATAVVG